MVPPAQWICGVACAILSKFVKSAMVAPADPGQVGDEGRPVDRRVDHVVAADGNGVLWIAGLHLERRRHLLDLLLDEPRLEMDAAILDLQPGAPERVEGARVQEVDADLLKYLHRMTVDLLNLVLQRGCRTA